MQIEIDFEVFKALTVRREHENVSYNDVLRGLLGIAGASVQIGAQDLKENPIKAFSSSDNVNGYAYRGGFLPNGTKLKALYKNRIYNAEIVDGAWVSEDGIKHATPTAAVTHITHTTSNAGRFWSAKRPGDLDWRRLNEIQSNIL